MRLLALAPALLLACSAAAQPDPDPARLLTADDLREDLRVLRTVLEESHVGLDWYLPQEERDRRFAALDDSATVPRTVRSFHRLLLPLVGALRHGHTTLAMPYRGVGYRLREFDRDGRFLPLDVRLLDGRLYVATDLSDEQALGPGAQILAVDGRPVADLVAAMSPLLPTEGRAESYRAHQLGPGFGFSRLLDLLHGPAESFTVDALPLDGRPVGEFAVRALPPARMAERFRERTGMPLDTFPPTLGLRFPAERTALLRVGSFYPPLFGPDTPDLEAFLAEAFREIRARGVTDLLLDVRGNEGGSDDLATSLYTHLLRRPVRPTYSPFVVASNSFSSLPYIEDPSDVLRAFAASPGDFVEQGADGRWTLRAAFDDRTRDLEPAPNAFAGRLYVLLDGGSFSATSGFLGLVDRFHRGEGWPVHFIGDEGAFDPSGRGSGGQTTRFVLPRSRQRLTVPLLGNEPPPGEPASLLLPDHVVTPSIQDVLSGTDRAAEFALALAERAQRADSLRGR